MRAIKMGTLADQPLTRKSGAATYLDNLKVQTTLNTISGMSRYSGVNGSLIETQH